MTGFSESPETEATRNRVEVIMYVESCAGGVPSTGVLDELEGRWIVGLPMTDTIDRFWA